MPVVELLSHADIANTNGLCLVVLDGTLRKRLKVLHLNPALKKMPRLSLKDFPASNYRIRKVRLPHQLSTLEATCGALAQLEEDDRRFQQLLIAFDGVFSEHMARL